MSLPLTGLIVICGLMGQELVCQADVYHNMADSPAVREACPEVVNLMAAKMEGLREGQGLRQLRGKAECLPGELTPALSEYVIGYMQEKWAPSSANIVHHDANTGQVIDKGRWLAM